MTSEPQDPSTTQTPPGITVSNLLQKELLKLKQSEFVLNEKNEKIINLLLWYFTGNAKFEKDGLLLKKGILLYGGIGSGKTTIFKIFNNFTKEIRKNTFQMMETRYIVREFFIDGMKTIDRYGRESFGTAVHGGGFNRENPRAYFFDDLGLEESNSNLYGNKSNVIAEIILDRYNCFQDYGMKTHASTNLSIPELITLYGNRFADRAKEMFNVLTLNCKSFRK